jgi:DNA-binding PadR family transcriptional regulator
MDVVQREILQSFWKIHVLHHAAEGPVYGQWMLHELREHGYEVSPGTLFPMLARMEKRGWLRCEQDPNGGSRARKDYYLTEKGREVLAIVQQQLNELRREVADPG